MRRDATVFAWLILILGVFGTANGSAILIRGAFHAEGASCKAICGISRLFADFFRPWLEPPRRERSTCCWAHAWLWRVAWC